MKQFFLFSLPSEWRFEDLPPGDNYKVTVTATSQGHNPVNRVDHFEESTNPKEPNITGVIAIEEHSVIFGWDEIPGFHEVNIFLLN